MLAVKILAIKIANLKFFKKRHFYYRHLIDRKEFVDVLPKQLLFILFFCQLPKQIKTRKKEKKEREKFREQGKITGKRKSRGDSHRNIIICKTTRRTQVNTDINRSGGHQEKWFMAIIVTVAAA